MAASISSADFAYVGPDRIAGKYLRRFWQPIYVAANLKKQFPIRLKMLDEFFTLYRGDSGAVFTVQDRCPHRRTSLAYGWIEADCIRCRYHGWKFDGAGQAVELPAESDAYRDHVTIAAYPTQEYLGLIFAYFGEGEPPPLMRFKELEDDTGGTLVVRSADLPHNYFQRIENDHDEVHVHFTHRDVAMRYGFTELPKMSAEEREFGFVSIATRSDGSRRMAYCFMPNCQMTTVPNAANRTELAAHLAWRVPIDDTNTRSFIVNRVPNADFSRIQSRSWAPFIELSRRIMASELRLEDVDPDHPELFFIQDIVAIGGQGEIVDHSAEKLGQSDKAVIMLRQIWAREVQALHDGRPLTNWWRPDDVLTVRTSVLESA
jgi:5,5'-dehydrodivanillate O-demethylase oxygenase subunit